ncbi:DUF4165 domain-containing protein (plasmid) [Alcaligenes faecalis]|nr:DUF4165 domain-containing protein [Alcaligenes faecalis]
MGYVKRVPRAGRNRWALSLISILGCLSMSTAAFAEVLEMHFNDPVGEQRVVSPTEGYSNPVGKVSYYIGAGVDRKVRITILSESDSVISTKVSELIGATDLISTSDGRNFYGAILEVEAPKSGSYKIKSEILTATGSVVSNYEYPMVIHTEAPTGTQINLLTTRSTDWPGIDAPVVGHDHFTGIAVVGAQSEIGIKKVKLSIYNEDGSLSNRLEQSYSSSGATFTKRGMWPEHIEKKQTLKFEVIDKAGNKNIINQPVYVLDRILGKASGTHHEDFEVVAVYDPITAESTPFNHIPGLKGYIPYVKGVEVKTNPTHMISRYKINQDGDYSPFGLDGFNYFCPSANAACATEKIHSDSEYIYRTSGDIQISDTSFSSNVRLHNRVGMYLLAPFDIKFSDESKLAPRTASGGYTYVSGAETGRKVTNTYSGNPYGKDARITEIYTAIEPRSYEQNLSININGRTQNFKIPPNATSHTYATDVSFYEHHLGSPNTRYYMNIQKRLSGNGFPISYAVGQNIYYDFTEPLIHSVNLDILNKELKASASETMNWIAAGTNYYGIDVGKSFAKIYNVKGEDFTLPKKKAEALGSFESAFVFDLSNLPNGEYKSIQIHIFDKYGNEAIEIVDAGMILDSNAPDVEIKAGSKITSLDEVIITLSDDTDPNPTITAINLQGGPFAENVELVARSIGENKYMLEYPILFPSMEEGERYRLKVTARDNNGNEGTSTVNFLYSPRIVSLLGGMDGRIYLPAVPEVFESKNGNFLKSEQLTLADGSVLAGQYDIVATLSGSSAAPLVINGTSVQPGETMTVANQIDFSSTDGRISLPMRAAVEGLTGLSNLIVTTTAPNSPVLVVNVELWNADIDLQSKFWTIRQVIDPLEIIAMPKQGVPCRTTIDAAAARKADIASDPVCLIEWTETPDEALPSTDKAGGLTVAGLVGQAVRLGDQKVKFDVFVFSGDGAKIKVNSGERTIKVISALNTIRFEPNIKSAHQKIQHLDIRFNQVEGPCCTVTLSADEAMTVASKAIRDSSARSCLFEWQLLPDGLMQNKFATLPQAEGTLDTVGDHMLGWRLSMFSRLGTRITLAEQAKGIVVIPPPVPTIGLSSNFDMKNGTYMVPVGESYVGDAVITAENSELTIDIETTNGETVSETFPRNAWSAAQSVTRRIVNTDTELWGKRQIRVRAAYKELSEVSSEETYVVYTVPSTRVKPFIETTAESALDTELLPVTVKMLDMFMYRDPYDNQTMGSWKVRVMRQLKAGEYEPLTDFVETVDGVANFDVDVSGVEGRTVRLVAEAHLISPIEGYERIEVSPRPLFPGVLLGGEIGGDIVARRISGQAPFSAVFRAVLADRVMFASVGDIIWEVSDDAGATWESHHPAERQKFSFVQNFNTGTYRVRAKIVNRYSGLEQYTGQVEITAYDKPMVQVEGPKVMFVGTTATLQARTVTESLRIDEDGKRQRVFTEYPQDAVNIDWSLDNGKTYTHTGNVIEITSNNQERISVWARVRTTHSPENDQNAYTITKSSVEFKAVRPPRIRISGHARVEKGVPYTFTAEATHAYRDMDLPIHGYFTLPDGTRVDSDTAVYIPTEDDVLKGRISTTYTAWIEGFREEGAEHTQEIVSTVWQYVWPKFVIDFSTDAQVAPANLTLRVRPLRLNGNLEDPTYKWDLPLDAGTVTNANSDTTRQLTINEPGDYAISVTVRDARGNESVVTYPFTIGQAEPYTIDLNYSASNVYMREPVDITIRPEIRGGHPKDRVEAREFFINGEPLESSRLYARTSLSAGEHEVGLRINTRHGKQEEATLAITVVPNQPPVCQVTHKKSSSAVVVYAECEDPDGRIRDYEWTLNGERVSSSSRSINVGRRTGGDNPVITVTAIDDSGGRSNTVEFETSFVSADE